MKISVLVCALTISALGQSAGTKSVQTTAVAGESWLKHLHRTFEETSMGKTSRLGPPTATDADERTGWQLHLASDSGRQVRTLHGSDLYRLNCQGCHGELGLGAPPEINSVINPTRATSTQVIVERMKNVGMEMSYKDAAELANQSKTALLQRLHKGGTDMPPFPHLNDAEVHAIFAYLKLLAEVPGAERQQVSVQESRVRVGEHIVKSTCHICHDAAGPNPTAEQLFSGVIPPLSALTARTTLPQFQKKVASGAPIMMGSPLSAYRGRMPVFYYLTDDEVTDTYLYLTLYPPDWTVPDPTIVLPEQRQAASTFVPVEFNVTGELAPNPAPAPPQTARNLGAILLPIIAEVFVGLLLAGGFWFTLREIRRLTAQSYRRKVLVMGADRVGLDSPLPSRSRPVDPPRTHFTSEGTASDMANHDREPAFHHLDHRRFESSWFARWLEGEDEAA